MQSGRSVRLTSRLYLVAGLRMVELLPQLSPYVFMV
jgi:hypothetical protein